MKEKRKRGHKAHIGGNSNIAASRGIPRRNLGQMGKRSMTLLYSFCAS